MAAVLGIFQRKAEPLRWRMAFSPLIGGVDGEGCRQSVVTRLVMPLLLATYVIVGGELGD